jgi:CheY-like chemotaxis protein
MDKVMSYSMPIAAPSRVRERPPPYDRSGPALPRVLLVEDSALARKVAARALAGAFEVTTAEDGEHALRAVRPGAFDILVTDQHMAAMTGLELLELVRVIDPRVRRVLTSGSDLPGIAAHVALGVVELWLLKPVDLRAELLRLCARAPTVS